VVFEWEEKLSVPHGISLDTVREVLSEVGYSVDAVFAHNAKQVDYVAKPHGN
jgi:hypothetical protein